MLVGAVTGKRAALALVARRASRVISRKMAPLARGGGARRGGELDFAVERTNVREVNDVLAAMDAMRDSLAESLEARWAAERDQREQVASLAHDLKTPLTVLRANADFVAEELGGEGTPDAACRAELAAAAHDIADGAERLDGYVHLLIDASRGAGGAVKAPVRPAELCGQIAAEAEPVARAHGAELAASVDRAVADAPEALLDRAALARAAANLVANAAEHARSCVELTCALRTRHWSSKSPTTGRASRPLPSSAAASVSSRTTPPAPRATASGTTGSASTPPLRPPGHTAAPSRSPTAPMRAAPSSAPRRRSQSPCKAKTSATERDS